MTIQELKRDIVRLNKSYLKIKNNDNYDDYYSKIKEIKYEFKRLYYANDNFEGLNSKHILIMIRLNLTLRIISFHNFGINIDLEKL